MQLFKAAGLLLLLTPSLIALEPARRVPPPNAQAEFQKAGKAEQAQQWETALLAYENVLDATRPMSVTTARPMLHRKLAQLKAKVAPNANPGKAGVWNVKAYAFRTTDVSWKDNNGTNRHALFRFTDAQLANLRHEMTNFATKVWDYTQGSLRIRWDLTVIDSPLREWHGWPDIGSCMPHFTDLKHGDADSIFVFAKAERGPEDQPCDKLEWIVWGGTIGVTAETKGACYIGFNCGPDPAEGGSGELELHEWLHAAEMGMRWVQAYGDQGVVDWTSDGGGFHEEWGLWKRPEGDPHWLDFYRTIMGHWTTRKMWRELTISRRSNNPWLNDYVRDFLVLGPFDASGKPHDGLDEPWIDEAAVQPKLDNRTAEKEWKLASAPGKFVTLVPVLGQPAGSQVFYLAFVVHADEACHALFHNQRDGRASLWQNGELIHSSRIDRSWDHVPSVIDVELKPGRNLFLLKDTRFSGDWCFSLKITDPAGMPLPRTRFELP